MATFPMVAACGGVVAIIAEGEAAKEDVILVAIVGRDWPMKGIGWLPGATTFGLRKDDVVAGPAAAAAADAATGAC